MRFLIWVLIFVYTFHSGPIDIDALNNDVIELKHFTLTSCAKTCLKEKKLKCKYFKFVEKTSICYLSSKDHPDFNQSSVPTVVPKVVSVKPTAKAPKKTKKDNAKIKKLVKMYKKAHIKEKKLKGMKIDLKRLKHLVRYKGALRSKTNRKLFARIGKEGKILISHNRILRVLARNIASVNRAFVLLHQYQKHLRQKIRVVMTGKGKMEKKINYLHKQTNTMKRTNILHNKRVHRLWKSNNKLWKNVRLINRRLRKNINLIPKHIKKYLVALSVSARRSNKLHKKVTRILRILGKMKKSGMINWRTKTIIGRNIRNLKRSLKLLKHTIRLIANFVIAKKSKKNAGVKVLLKQMARIKQFDKDIKKDEVHTKKDVSKVVRQLFKIQKKASKLGSQLQRQRKLTFSLMRDMQHIAGTKPANISAPTTGIAPGTLKILSKVHSAESILAKKVFYNHFLLKSFRKRLAKQARITNKINNRLSHIDTKASRKLQENVKHLQMLMVKQRMLHNKSAKDAVKAPILLENQRKLALKLKQMEQKSKLMYRLAKTMFTKLKKERVEEKLTVKWLVKQVRKLEQHSKRHRHHNVIYGKVRHNAGGYSTAKQLKKWRKVHV